MICNNCVMDVSDPLITFNHQGICNHCVNFKNVTSKNWFPNEEGKNKINTIFNKIKNDNADKKYDCILGLSGGLDSSYLALKLFDAGLRPLVVHVDAGWNDELAVNNIEMIVQYCKWDLHTVVIDWEEMKDLQFAYLKSGVANQDVPQDHIFASTLYNFAAKKNIRYIMNGGNISTECIFPSSWLWDNKDSVNLKSIHKKYGKLKLKKYKTISLFELYFYFPFIRKIKAIRPLNFMVYNKNMAIEELESRLEFKTYSKKHGESIFTKFYQNYWLPKKYGFDKRRPHLSSLIVTGQMSRNEALKKLNEKLYDENELNEDLDFVAKKFNLTTEEFKQIIQNQNQNHSSFRNQKNIKKILKSFYNIYKRIIK